MPRSWPDKFKSAFRGVWLAICSERSFAIHLPAAAAVGILAAIVDVSLMEACILGLCATIVLAAEVFNTAIERLAREISREERPGLAAALDMASGAVLLCSLGAAAIGAAIFIHRLGTRLGWWS